MKIDKSIAFFPTLSASRKICVPWRVAYFQGYDAFNTPHKIVDILTEGEYTSTSIPAAPLLSMRNSVGFSFCGGRYGIC
jgi:hypothetical protein